MKAFVAFVGLMIIGESGWAVPAATFDDLKAVENQLKQEQQAQKKSQQKVAVLTREVKEVQGDLISTAKKIQRKENELSALEQQKKEYLQKQEILEDKLDLTDKQLYRVMKGLQTLSLRPTELLLVQKKTPVQTLRSKMLMNYSVPMMGQIKQETLSDLQELMKVRQQLGDRVVRIQQVHFDLTEQNKKMNQLLAEKKKMQQRYTSDYMQSKKKAQMLATKAQDLKDLLKKLEEEQARKQQALRPVGTGRFERSYGRLSWPAGGQLMQHFGEKTGAGAHTKGVILRTHANGRLTAPFDGVVLFAGPFQNYGQLLIIDHGDNYMTVLAGMKQIDVMVGQELLAGEPIGAMGESYTDLYLEMRHQGQAIDPEPWFIKGRIA